MVAGDADGKDRRLLLDARVEVIVADAGLSSSSPTSWLDGRQEFADTRDRHADWFLPSGCEAHPEDAGLPDCSVLG
jgi:hypothetical protein